MLDFIADIIFPQNVCCLCRKPGLYSTRNPWCKECYNNMLDMQLYLPICSKCGKYLEEGEGLCADCANNPPQFHVARSVGPYSEPYRIAIKVLKFMGKKKLAVSMGHMMAITVKNEPNFWPLDVIVPVPISKGRLKQRGFNQTELLAKQISKDLRLGVNNKALKRIKETPAQRELNKEEREKNLLCAFVIEDNKDIYKKNVLLVDDIYTTGSTSKECTRTLMRAGANRVSVITWATGQGF
ncbi:MAG TPA: ComF family protein [Syntrophomonadaceae bacterium]|nr:ComF family protein [Syntrophomonadaceae bacterium]